MKKTFLASFVLFVASLDGADVEFRLVPFNQLDVGVDFVVGQKTAQDAQYLYTLTEGERHAFFPPHTAWARNIRIDGKPAFEIFLATTTLMFVKLPNASALFGSSQLFLAMAVSFGVGMVVLFLLMTWLKKFSFAPIALYRIALGLFLLWYF